MGKTKCTYNWFSTGKQAFYDGSTFETLSAGFPVFFYDDFIGADVVFPATASPESGCVWTKKIVSSNSTVAKTGDGVNGLVACALAANSEKEDAALHMNDELMFSIAQGAVMEVRAALTVAPTGNGICQIGLYGDWKDAGSDYRVGFEIPSTLIVTCESDDGSTDTSAASSTTLVAGTYYIFRIDCSSQSDIKFYINGERVCASTTFANAASAANSKCQPQLGMYKASGTGVGTLSVDYVKIWQNRS